MNISNELLAAYAAGNVTNDERNAVRQYLAEHPQELESVMMMMDEDYELDLDDAEENIKKYRNQFSKTAALLGMKYDVLLLVLFCDKGNFYKRAQYMPFYKNIVNEGVEWYGRSA